MITADKKVHDEVMAHPTHEKYLNKKIEMYEEIALVVGKYIANGCFAKQFGDVDLTLETEDASTRTEFDYEDVSKEAGKDIGKESSSTVSEKWSHKKRKTRDDESLKISKHMSEMAKAMKALSQDQKQDRISSLYKVVMAIEGYDEVALARAFDYMLENENVGRGFMVKNDFLRKVWLDTFLQE